MNFFHRISNFVLILLAAGPWLFPEVSSWPLKNRIAVSAIILAILLASNIGSKLLNWLRKTSPALQSVVKKTVQITTHPLAKASYVFVLLASIVFLSSFNTIIVYLSLAVFFLYLTSVKWYLVKNVSFNDTFDSELGSWKVISGNPSINDKFGNPAPNLDLHVVQGVKTNCLLELLTIDTPERGTIECDVYLEPGSLFNIVFRADIANEKWYMARLETRGGSEDAILKDEGQGWSFVDSAGANSSPDTWHRMKVDLEGSKAKLYRDGKLLAKIEDSDFKDGKIGIFNEVGEVHIDNFSVTSHGKKHT